MSTIKELFTKHPREAGQTYWEHFAFAVAFGTQAILAGCAAIVHALFPFVLQTTASTKVLQLVARIQKRATT